MSGRKFLEYVQEQWESHHAEKEKEKLERVGLFPLVLTLQFSCIEGLRFNEDVLSVGKLAIEENKTDPGGHAIWNGKENAVQEAHCWDTHTQQSQEG